jgi:hypothetical protein
MRHAAGIVGLTAALVSGIALGACERRTGIPIQDEPLASALRDVAGPALEDLRAARRSLEASPPSASAAEASLASADRRMSELVDYYLPLLDANERAFRAYRFYFTDRDRIAPELERVEELLDGVARARGYPVEGELEEPLALVADVRAALESGSPNAEEHLRDLTRRLSFLVVKGELVLRPTGSPN